MDCRRSRAAACTFLLLWLGSMAASSLPAEEVDIHATAEHFVWQEFSDNGARLLKESGTLLGAGVSFRKDFPNHAVLNESADIFGGKVGYDGSTLGGGRATTSVDYLGFKLKGEIGRSIDSDGRSLEPFAGLGIRAWMRRIRNGSGTTPSGLPVSVQGYTEHWTTLHARLGARGSVAIAQGNRAYAEAGIKLPLYSANTAYLSTTGAGPDVTLHPAGQPSLFAEAGVRARNFKADVYYDGLRFARSPSVSATFQPRSTADIYGLSLGLVF